MFVDHLELEGPRSYEAAKLLDIGLGVSVFVGPNGHGKTNLVEAVTCRRAVEPPGVGRCAIDPRRHQPGRSSGRWWWRAHEFPQACC